MGDFGSIVEAKLYEELLESREIELIDFPPIQNFDIDIPNNAANLRL